MVVSDFGVRVQGYFHRLSHCIKIRHTSKTLNSYFPSIPIILFPLPKPPINFTFYCVSIFSILPFAYPLFPSAGLPHRRSKGAQRPRARHQFSLPRVPVHPRQRGQPPATVPQAALPPRATLRSVRGLVPVVLFKVFKKFQIVLFF